MLWNRNHLVASAVHVQAFTIHIVLSAWLASSVVGINVCLYHQCTPDCICDITFDDQCAMEYGNYGWMVPENADDYVYTHMRPDVSDSGVMLFVRNEMP